MEDKGEEQVMANGLASSSKIPGFHYIPTGTLVRLGRRFELGIERKGEKAWNAISDNQCVLGDREFILHRIGHIVSHAYAFRDKLIANKFKTIGDDDAGAILWGGSFLGSVLDWYYLRDGFKQEVDVMKVQEGGKFKVWDIVQLDGEAKPYVITEITFHDGLYQYDLRHGDRRMYNINEYRLLGGI